MDVSEMVSEFVSLKRRAEHDGALPSGSLVRWEILRQGLLLAQTVAGDGGAAIPGPRLRLETGRGVLDLPVVSVTADGCVVAGVLGVADGERPVVLLLPEGDEVPIPTRAVVTGPALGDGRRHHLALPYLTDPERRRLAAPAPTPDLEELAR